jgi:Holliday junction resolvase RusA-like endonuclease
VISFTILGQPYSKANRRRIVHINGHIASIKSSEARAYERSATMQIPASARVMLDCPVRVTMRIFYASERPDLDESVILDVLQARYSQAIKGVPRQLVRAGVIINDRQVRERHIYHGIDKVNPRAEIEVEPITA